MSVCLPWQHQKKGAWLREVPTLGRAGLGRAGLGRVECTNNMGRISHCMRVVSNISGPSTSAGAGYGAYREHTCDIWLVVHAYNGSIQRRYEAPRPYGAVLSAPQSFLFDSF